jgi:hypothetical protein
MSPPGGIAATRSGPVSNQAEAPSQTQRAIKAAHIALAHAGITMSPSRVSRIVRRFEKHVERNGWSDWSFPEFLTDGVHLSPEQRTRLLCDPDLARATKHFDPVGEDAVFNVMRAGGGGQ